MLIWSSALRLSGRERSSSRRYVSEQSDAQSVPTLYTTLLVIVVSVQLVSMANTYKEIQKF